MGRRRLNSRPRRSRLLLGAGLAVTLAAALAVFVGIGQAAPAAAPQNLSKPTISGKAQVGRTLTASQGTWTNNPVDFNFQWLRCDKSGDDCANIAGATKQTYALVTVDAGHRMRVSVTATNADGKTTATSDPTDVVQPKAAASPPPPPPPPPPAPSQPGGAIKLPSGLTSIPASSVALPARLIVDQIRSTPSRITSRSVPLVARFHVVDTRGFVVRDALVFAVGVPFNRLSNESEARTGQDGWATVSFRVLPTFSLRPGNLVVIFVRARKEGDNVLAGVSTRRLVSVRIG